MAPDQLKKPFDTEQTNFLVGLALGAEVARHSLNLPLISGSGGPNPNAVGAALLRGESGSVASFQAPPHGPDHILVTAHQRARVQGRLSNEEVSKQCLHPLDNFSLVAEGDFTSTHASNVAKYYGIHINAGSELGDCRSKLINGAMRSWQLRGLAAIADNFGSRRLEFTHHGDVRLPGVKHRCVGQVIEQFIELGLAPQGAGGDTCRSILSSPISGLDPTETTDVRGLVQRIHHALQHQRDVFCLPHKFRIGVDGGGQFPLDLARFDLGLRAVAVPGAAGGQPLFLLSLGGTGSQNKTAQDTALYFAESQVVPVILEILRVYASLGDRIHRERARLGFLLEEMSMEAFLEVVRMRLRNPWQRQFAPSSGPALSPKANSRDGWFEQKQGNLFCVPFSPVNRTLSSGQCYSLANIMEEYGTAELRVSAEGTLFLIGMCLASRSVIDDGLKRLQSRNIGYQKN